MKRAVSALLLSCTVLTGCGVAGPDGVDVTPPLSATGAVELRRLPPVRFEGAPTRIGFEPIPLVGGDFPALTGFAFLPSGNDFLAVNRYGKVGHFRLEQNRAVLLGSFQIPAVHAEGECGAGPIAVDPDFSSNRLFYIAYCIDVQYSVVKRYTMSSGSFSETLLSSANVIATGDQKVSSGRNGIGSMEFGPDGAMWVNVGDRGRHPNAQNLTNELGKVIRFTPLKRANLSGYELPGGNAFYESPPNSSLIYAYGFRYPWRGAFDALGRYWVADVGQSQYEEINVLSRPGQNFGWSGSEGPLCTVASCKEHTRPVRHWDRAADHPFILEDPLAKANAAGRTAWVGIEYLPAESDPYRGLLTGKMLYGDFYAGYVRGIALDEKGAVVSDQHLGHIELPVAWRQGRDGYVYVGTMYESAPVQTETASASASAEELVEGQGSLWRAVPLP